MRNQIGTCWIVMLVVSGLFASPATDAQNVQSTPSFLGDSLIGKDSFEAYCATCHGADARGNGPIAPALKAAPADLTILASRNRGMFPRDQVKGIITGSGRTVAAHGTTEMPVWGPLFRAFESNARVNVRIDNLVAYLETVQAPQGHPVNSGVTLFRTYCASCHGADARGAGPMADQLRRMPPSLTSFAVRNRGVFPSERLRRIIDGRDVPAHGNSEMPVWGDAFRRTREGLSGDAATARIEAIVRYLETIQERATF